MWEMLELPMKKPEYLHVLLNGYPTHGVPLGVLGLLFGLFLKSRPAQMTALVIIFVSSLAAWPVYESGEDASDRISANADVTTQAWLEEHEHRAEQIIPIFYVVALVSFLALVVPKWKPKAQMPLTYATLGLSFLLLGAGGYIAYAGGKIAHTEFRVSPPPVSAPDNDSD